MNHATLFLTPKQAGATLGVSAAYLKAHEDALGLESLKTAGGHRRYPWKDVEILAERLTTIKQADLALVALLAQKGKVFIK